MAKAKKTKPKLKKKKALKRRNPTPASKITRLDLLEAIQKILDSDCGLNREHEIRDLMDYLDDPKSVMPFRKLRRNASWAPYESDNPKHQASRAKHAQEMRDDYAEKRAKLNAPWANSPTEAAKRKLDHDEYWDLRRGPGFGRRELQEGWDVAPRSIPGPHLSHKVNNEEDEMSSLLEEVAEAVEEAKRGNFGDFTYRNVDVLQKYLRDFPNGYYAKQVKAGFEAVNRMKAADQERNMQKKQAKYAKERESDLATSPFRRYY